MFFSTVALLSAVAGLVSAQGQVHTVKVGAGGLVYNPPSLNATVGDQVSLTHTCPSAVPDIAGRSGQLRFHREEPVRAPSLAAREPG
jgi:hypothetical protein